MNSLFHQFSPADLVLFRYPNQKPCFPKRLVMMIKSKPGVLIAI